MKATILWVNCFKIEISYRDEPGNVANIPPRTLWFTFAAYLNSKRTPELRTWTNSVTDIEAFLQTDVDLCRVVTAEFDDVTKRIEELGKTLNNLECPILVAGETSAGKSSLINLLIGKSILPEDLLSCTSTICKIWNSEDRKIIFTSHNGKQETYVFVMENYEEEMEDLLSEKMGKESCNTMKSVDIHISVPMLKKHIAIVDTPGIHGKEQTMQMELLFDYLPNAIAFIYVIDVSKAGGLLDDEWLQKILMKIKEQQYKGNMLDFQTDTTLFVCNKWDQVKPKKEQKVIDFISSRLKSIWPNVNIDKQVYRVSCKKEMKRINKQLPQTEKFTNLAAGITNMMPKILEAKMIRHVRLASLIASSKQSMVERERRKKESEARLDLLEHKVGKYVFTECAIRRSFNSQTMILKDILVILHLEHLLSKSQF
ncbi:unnamed protein product [Mytilus edulis]|uniref:Dynamin N-terminal domain-containing protein n=1 Tax=Mytilus edulis TaxID=6550 RepID=A0A8S3TEA5_MYTED|nr:unnamed protein product [Mytilus edulis]